MNEFIITFRECLEACLIVGIIYTLLEKNNFKKEIKQLWLAVIAAVFSSMGVAFAINLIRASIGNTSVQSLFEGVSMYITAILLWYVIFWLSKHVSQRTAMEEKTQKAAKNAGWGIFLVVFFAILREGFETALFLMGSFNMSGSFSYLGFFAGTTIAILIGYAIVIQGRRINLKAFFRTTTFMLVIFASGMVAYGTHEVEEFVVKGNHLEKFGIKEKDQIPRVWDILKPKQETDESFFYSYNINGKDKYTHLFHDKGRIGVFLKGFFGYNSNPNYPEVILWLISLFFGIRMWKRFYF